MCMTSQVLFGCPRLNFAMYSCAYACIYALYRKKKMIWKNSYVNAAIIVRTDEVCLVAQSFFDLSRC